MHDSELSSSRICSKRSKFPMLRFVSSVRRCPTCSKVSLWVPQCVWARHSLLLRQGSMQSRTVLPPLSTPLAAQPHSLVNLPRLSARVLKLAYPKSRLSAQLRISTGELDRWLMVVWINLFRYTTLEVSTYRSKPMNIEKSFLSRQAASLHAPLGS